MDRFVVGGHSSLFEGFTQRLYCAARIVVVTSMHAHGGYEYARMVTSMHAHGGYEYARMVASMVGSMSARGGYEYARMVTSMVTSMPTWLRVCPHGCEYAVRLVMAMRNVRVCVYVCV